MLPQFNDIKVIIWDFDNTLYKSIPDLKKDFDAAVINSLIALTGWEAEKAETEFNRLHPSVYASDTMTIASLGNVTVPVAAVELEKHFDRTKYLRYDGKLVDLFTKLVESHKFSQYILTNGLVEYTSRGIQKLGVNPGIFQKIVTSEITGVNKPDPKAFQYILDLTGLPSTSHLMIGDRDSVDLATAKTLGMKTCLVWGQSSIADISLQTVYEVEKILL